MKGLIDELISAQAHKRRPPIRRWQPTVFGEIDIRIAADGNWYHEGGKIERPSLVRLFASVLLRENDDYYLVTPVEKLRITVDEVPFVCVDAQYEGEGEHQRIALMTNVDDHLVLGAENPLWMAPRLTGDMAPFCHVRDQLNARIERSIFYHLIELAEELDGSIGVRSSGMFFSLGDA